MRVVVLGGTVFIGRAIVEQLVDRGHEVTVVHRGEHEPPGWVEVEHYHCERAELAGKGADVRAMEPDAVVDTIALTRGDAEAATAALPDVPVVVLSSLDVYRAYEDLLAGRVSQAVPLDEESPLRLGRFPHRELGGRLAEYDKIDVEETYASRGATICRLPVVFGPHDGQRREEFLLRRVRAGRERIPFGGGSWLITRLHVADAAAAVCAAVERQRAEGDVFNVVPRTTRTVREWAETILAAADWHGELVRVPDSALPSDLEISAETAQHLLVVSSRIEAALGWTCSDQDERVRQSVLWHLEHPPEASADSEEGQRRDEDAASDEAFSADEEALAAADTP